MRVDMRYAAIVFSVSLLVFLFLGFSNMRTVHRIVNIGEQPTIDAFEKAKNANATTLVRDASKSKVTLCFRDQSELNIIASETIIRREAASDKIAMLAFHLPPMTLDELLEAVDELRGRLGIPESDRERIEEWKAQANPDAYSVERLILNGLDGQPTRSIVVLRTYDRARPWFIELKFNWESSHPPTN